MKLRITYKFEEGWRPGPDDFLDTSYHYWVRAKEANTHTEGTSIPVKASPDELPSESVMLRLKEEAKEDIISKIKEERIKEKNKETRRKFMKLLNEDCFELDI